MSSTQEKTKIKLMKKKNIYTYQQSIAIRCMQRFFSFNFCAVLKLTITATIGPQDVHKLNGSES